MLFSFFKSDALFPAACCPARDPNVGANAKARFLRHP